MSQTFSPKLKEVMQQIEKLMTENDLGGYILIHEPGFSEYKIKVDPSYSTVRFGKNKDGSVGMMEFDNKLEDFEGDRKKWFQHNEETIELLRHITTIGGPHMMALVKWTQDLERSLGIPPLHGTHYPS